MPGLTDNETRALAYFAIGVTSEGSDVAYRLSLAGNTGRDAQGNPILIPVGNSGYSIGTLQTDLGQHPEVATQLTDAFQAWARTQHPDWELSAAQRNQTAADLGRTGHQIEAQHGRPLDATVKSHLDTFMASDAGISFVHARDTAQVDRLMTNAVAPLQGTSLYQNASEQDQARLIGITAKLYNQSETYGNRLLQQIESGQHHSVAEVSASLNRYADYVTDGRDHALQGTALFNDLRATPANHPMRPAWDNVLANPTVNPTQLGNDPTHPNLPHEYAVIKDAFVDPAHSRPMIQALGQNGSYAQTARDRGFYAEGRDMLMWDRKGNGHALVDGQWSSVDSRDIHTVRNADHTLDVNVRRNGADERLLHVTHPGQGRGQPSHTGAAHPDSASGDHVQRAGTLREHDHSQEVRALQAQLAQLGYKGADGRPITPDGDFGGNTKVALQSFQRDHHLTDDGVAGTKTFDALRQATQPAPSPVSLADASHPGHAMFQQATAGVHALDAKQGRTPDQLSANLAGSLVASAQAQGMTRIDHVALSDDAKRAYAVQGDLNSPFKQVAEVDVSQAVGKSVAQSSTEWQQNAAQAPQQATPQQAQPQPEQPGMHR